MKKILSLFLVVTFILSVIPVVGVNASEYKILYETNFDSDITDYPEGWFVPNDAFMKEHMYLQSKLAMTGKAMYFEDESLTKGIDIYSPFVKVTPGKVYTVEGYGYSTHDYITLKILFYAEDQTTYIGSRSDSVGAPVWQLLSNSMVAPEGAAYARIAMGTISNYEGIGAWDDVAIMEGIKWPSQPLDMQIPKQNKPVKSQLIEADEDTLKYNTYSDRGDTLADFSYAGFYAGKYEIPNSENLTVAAVIEPSKNKNEDDTKRIQAVIDEVADNAPNTYFKVIKLKAGRYNINKKGLDLRSGIILSGEGQGPSGTVLYAYEPVQYTVVKIKGTSPTQIGDRHYITDSYVPSGSNKINLTSEDIKNYKVGDLITIYHETTDEWVKMMDMDNVTDAFGAVTSWKGGMRDAQEERYITEINGNTITLDMPFYIPFDAHYSKKYIYKTSEKGRIEHVGIENMRLESYYSGDPKDENHASQAIDIANAKNCYVRDISAKYFVQGAVQTYGGAKQITVKNCSTLEPVSTYAGSRRYCFCIGPGTQQILITGCYSYNGRHDFVGSGNATGPSAFVNNIVDSGNSHTETHGLWSTGILYDNVLSLGKLPHAMGTPQYGVLGNEKVSSFGWTGGGIVYWNCLAAIIFGSNPPSEYNNFLIGQWGMYEGEDNLARKDYLLNNAKKDFRTTTYYNSKEFHFATSDNTLFVGDSYKESEAGPVDPRSIFKAQLSERLTGTIKNVRPNAPVIMSPRGEEEHKITSNKFDIKGVYETGAEKVTLYVDNEPMEGTLNKATNEFSLPVELGNGVHKVYATQTIGGVESTKTADRFLVVNTVNSNKDYLQSKYEYDKIHQTLNDDIITFDVYQKPFEDIRPDNITVKVNGSMLEADVDPVEINGRVLVPMRAIFETYGASVEWDEATATATATKEDRVIQITENSTIAKVDGKECILDVPATIINGRFVVPVRFISESFGADVGWIDSNKTVVISYTIRSGLVDEIPIVALTQSGDDGAGAVIENVLDANPETSWAVSTTNKNGSWGILDLGETKNIKNIYIAFRSGKERSYSFDILVSDDGENYATVLEKAVSSGRSETMEPFKLNVSGRYIKIIGLGNSSNAWNNYTEIAVTENR